MIDLDAVVALERAVWDALVDGDPAADESLLAHDFLGVYPTGFANRGDHVGQLAGGPSIAEYGLESPRRIKLGESCVGLAYAATFRRAGSDATERMYVTSIWARRGDRWVNVFSQDTPAVEGSD